MIYNKILYKYGFFVLICVRNVMSQNEKYEECSVINKILLKKGLPTNMTAKEYAERYGKDKALLAANDFLKALQMCVDEGIIEVPKL